MIRNRGARPKEDYVKLNYKKTVLVGFAFFLICLFWQAYDTLIPKILTDKFGLSQTASGVIMALDNIVALFMLPLFGALSDKCRSKMGRRTPFILIGTVVAIALIFPLSISDRMQLENLSDGNPTDREASLSRIWDENPEIADPRPGKTGKVALQELYETREAFVSIPLTDENGDLSEEQTDVVIPARQAYARQVTKENPAPMIVFMGALILLLLSMSVFRSPAVALMPDVTIKPLRSKANAVINLMGAIGGILTLVLGLLLGTGKPENALMHYGTFFLIVAALMAVSLAIFLAFVREPRYVREMEEESERLGISSEVESELDEAKREAAKHGGTGALLPLLLILASVVFWYMGYNAVTSKYSVYAGEVLGLDYNLTLLLAQGVTILAFLPIGFLSEKIGRKRTILGGVILMTVAFFCCSFLRQNSPPFLVNILFCSAGIGWAAINVNSFPMVVELCNADNVGKYTGYYYTASMAAQTLTPILSGFFMDRVGMTSLFPYASVCVFCALITMIFVKRGDNREIKASANDAKEDSV